MRKIFRLNKTGTLGVTIPEQMQKAGFTQGMSIVWMPQANGFLLKLEHVPMTAIAPSAPIVDVKPAPVQETP